jgi:hypothetical protein
MSLHETGCVVQSYFWSLKHDLGPTLIVTFLAVWLIGRGIKVIDGYLERKKLKARGTSNHRKTAWWRRLDPHEIVTIIAIIGGIVTTVLEQWK